MAWYLNAFLTSYRKAVNVEFPKRGRASDGTIGDQAHAARTSEHNPDADGSVDAWDLDVNLLGSSSETGTKAEQAAMRTLLGEFQRQPQAQLWIYQGKIANRDVGNWRVRDYLGANPHDKHAHLQSRESQEKRPYTGDLDEVFDAPSAKPKPGGPKPGSRTLKEGMSGPDVAYLQRWLGLPDDGKFGPKTEARVRWYQKMRGLGVDGMVGPKTWRAMGIKA